MKDAVIKEKYGIKLFYFERLLRPFPNHFHENCLVGTVLDGERKIQLSCGEAHLHRGDVLFLPPYQPHSCSSRAAKPSAWLSIQIPPERMLRLCPCGNRPAILRNNQRLTEVLQSLWNIDPPNWDIAVLENILLAELPGHTHKASNRPLPEFCHWLAASLREKVSLDHMAVRLGVNKFQLVRQFNRDLGISPYKYLESLRIIHACRLLASRCSLADCSVQTGFYDQAQFSRIFKAQLGLTPGAWRRLTEGPRYQPEKGNIVAIG